jgi:hypothetical protein
MNEDTENEDTEDNKGYAGDGVVWGCVITLAVIGVGISVLVFGGMIMRLAGL